MNNSRRRLLDVTTKHGHTDLGENVQDGEHDSQQVAEWTNDILASFNDDPHNFDFIEQSEKLDHANEDNHFENLDDLVILLVVKICVIDVRLHVTCQEENHGWDAENLAQCFDRCSEMVLICLYETSNNPISNHFQEEETVQRDLEQHPNTDSLVVRSGL